MNSSLLESNDLQEKFYLCLVIFTKNPIIIKWISIILSEVSLKELIYPYSIQVIFEWDFIKKFH